MVGGWLDGWTDGRMDVCSTRSGAERPIIYFVSHLARGLRVLEAVHGDEPEDDQPEGAGHHEERLPCRSSGVCVGGSGWMRKKGR